ncbi:MAG TPA: metalloregulator ArsR/SmtB family transcription factor [Vicinamibacterales bacterium]|nr:metalloregulator ArsR/SmtB family transcription factor [Vicinamibacterales bacterium]
MSVERALQALGDPTRRAIFDRLRKASASVGELAEGMPVSRPAVSQHLKVLRTAGLVRERREGVRHVYQVELRGLVELRRYVDRLWGDALSAFERAARAQDRAREPK